MTMSPAVQRKSRMIEILESQERVLVADLARMFDVSDMTIRRDLESLERSGAVSRVHGGAVRAQSRSYEPPFETRLLRKVEAKQRIAAAAVTLIGESEAIILDAGTTTLELARILGDRRDLRVLAMSLHIANVLSQHPGITLMICGGTVRFGEQSLTGALASQTFADFSFDTLFLTAGGVDAEGGVTEYNPEDAAVKRSAFASARRRIVLADGSKIGNTAFARVCTSDELDAVVTDPSANAVDVEALRSAGVNVIVA